MSTSVTRIRSTKRATSVVKGRAGPENLTQTAGQTRSFSSSAPATVLTSTSTPTRRESLYKPRGTVEILKEIQAAQAVAEAQDISEDFERLFVDETIGNANEDQNLSIVDYSRRNQQGNQGFRRNTTADTAGDAESVVDANEMGGTNAATDELTSNAFLSGMVDPSKTVPLKPISKRIYKVAKRSCRDVRVWESLVTELNRQILYLRAEDIVVVFYSLSKVKYRDPKLLRELSFQSIRNLHFFTPRGIALLFNAHKKLEFHDVNNLQLLLRSYVALHLNWEPADVALMANASAYFYLYEPKLWKNIAKKMEIFCNVPATKETSVFTPQGLTLLAAAMARLDWRDARTLLLLGRCASRQSSAFDPANLATLYSSLCKLDFDSKKLFMELEETAIKEGYIANYERISADGNANDGEKKTNPRRKSRRFASNLQADLEADGNHNPYRVLTDPYAVPTDPYVMPKKSNAIEDFDEEGKRIPRFDLHALSMLLQASVCFTKIANRRPEFVRALINDVAGRASEARSHHVYKLKMAYLWLKSQSHLESEFTNEICILEDVLMQAHFRRLQQRGRRKPSCLAKETSEMNEESLPMGEVYGHRNSEKVKKMRESLKAMKSGFLSMHNPNDTEEFVRGGGIEQTFRQKSRWVREVMYIMQREMGVKLNRECLVHDDVEDLVITNPEQASLLKNSTQMLTLKDIKRIDDEDFENPMLLNPSKISKDNSNNGGVVLYCVGAYSYYSDTTRRTAFSKLYTKLLEIQGYSVLHIPYYEWSELRLPEDKILYLLSKGRQLAQGIEKRNFSGEGEEENEVEM